MSKLDIEEIKHNAVKVKEITCIVAIDDSDKDLTTAIIGYKTKDERLIILGEFYNTNIVDEMIIDELRKAIDDKNNR